MKLLTIREAAKRLSMSIGKLYTLRQHDPSFPKPVQHGKSRAFIEDDLTAWESARYAAQRAENAERLKNLTPASAR